MENIDSRKIKIDFKTEDSVGSFKAYFNITWEIIYTAKICSPISNDFPDHKNLEAQAF